MLALALVLDIAPVHLIVPLDGDELAITPNVTENVDAARAWVRGLHHLGPLDDSDPTAYARHAPADEQPNNYKRLADSFATYDELRQSGQTRKPRNK